LPPKSRQAAFAGFCRKKGSSVMIILTKLNDVPFALNSDMIETIQENPDTTICLFNKNIYIVKESMQEVMDKIVAFRRKINEAHSRVSPEYLAGDEAQ
jgi:flagellar protein FlbD